MIIEGAINDNISDSGNSRPVMVDLITGSLVVVGLDHYKIHEGSSWHVFDDTANIGGEAGDFISIQFTTAAANSGLMHTVFTGYCASAYTFDLREAQTGGGAGGGVVTPVNRRRDNVDTPISMTKDDTVGTGGTVLFSYLVGAGKGAHEIGGTSRGQREWVLKAATVYQVRVYSNNASAATVSIDYYVYADRD